VCNLNNTSLKIEIKVFMEELDKNQLNAYLEKEALGCLKDW